MSPSILSLLAFVAWTILIVVILGSFRAVAVITGKNKPNDFPADQDHGGSDFYKRLRRVHMNCVENLPLYGAVILTAAATGISGLTDPYAWWFLGFRLAQSTVHMIGTNAILVNIRFGFFGAQLIIMVLMIKALVI